MTLKEIVDGLQFTLDMFLFDPTTGETYPEPRNDMDKITIDACKGAIELLEQQPCEEYNYKALWEQVKWERDVAIEQLEQLGYSLGEKIRTSEDCISRQALIEKATSWDKHFTDSERYVSLTDIMSMPSVTPQPKRGKWEVIRKEYEFMGGIVNEPQGCKCSNCGGIVKFKSDFCPSCGCYCGGDDNGDSECTM